MLVIKLSKIGKKNKKVFRVVISEKGRDTFGKMLEILGSYNPYTKELQIKADRVKHWLSHGAQMTPTVNNLLISKNIIEGEKVKTSKPGKPSEKRLTQKKAKEEKKKGREEAVKPQEKSEELQPEAKDEAKIKEEPKTKEEAKEVKINDEKTK